MARTKADAMRQTARKSQHDPFEHFEYDSDEDEDMSDDDDGPVDTYGDGEQRHQAWKALVPAVDLYHLYAAVPTRTAKFQQQQPAIPCNTDLFATSVTCAGPPPRRDDGWALAGDWAITTNDKQYSNSW